MTWIDHDLLFFHYMILHLEISYPLHNESI